MQSEAIIDTSIGDVWLATQKPQFLGLYSSLWKVITAEIDLAIIRKPIRETRLFIQWRRRSFGTLATTGNAATNQTT